MNYAFVPARSGSTRLANKNVKELYGKPLIGWSLQAAMLSKSIDKVIFSTNSPEYISIAKGLCSDFQKELLVDNRSEEHAQTKSKIFDYLKSDLLTKFDFKDDDYLVQLLPTCPLRRPEHIDEAVTIAKENNCGVFSATPYDFHVSFAFSGGENNTWVSLFEDSPMKTGNTQSQSQKAYLHPNGSINVLPISLLKQNHSSIYYGCCYYEMPRIDSVDIDDLTDFQMAEFILKAREVRD